MSKSREDYANHAKSTESTGGSWTQMHSEVGRKRVKSVRQLSNRKSVNSILNWVSEATNWTHSNIIFLKHWRVPSIMYLRNECTKGFKLPSDS